MIVVVSDVHLAEKPNDAKVEKDDREFLEFLNHIKDDQLSDGGDLVILGDMVDFLRRDFAKALMEVEGTFSELTSFKYDVKVHYVVGNHDYYMLKLKKNLLEELHFSNVAKSVRLSSGDKDFFFIHGYQLETLANPYYKSQTTYEQFAEQLCLCGDDIGSEANILWELWNSLKIHMNLRQVEKQATHFSLKRRPKNMIGALKSMMEGPGERLCGHHEAALTIENLAKSRSRTVYLGMEIDEFLIYGHTHMSFC